jgi:hypothetical protein
LAIVDHRPPRNWSGRDEDPQYIAGRHAQLHARSQDAWRTIAGHTSETILAKGMEAPANMILSGN